MPTVLVWVAAGCIVIGLIADAAYAWAEVIDAGHWNCNGRPSLATGWHLGRWLPPAVLGLGGCLVWLLRGRRRPVLPVILLFTALLWYLSSAVLPPLLSAGGGSTGGGRIFVEICFDQVVDRGLSGTLTDFFRSHAITGLGTPIAGAGAGLALLVIGLTSLRGRGRALARRGGHPVDPLPSTGGADLAAASPSAADARPIFDPADADISRPATSPWGGPPRWPPHWDLREVGLSGLVLAIVWVSRWTWARTPTATGGAEVSAWDGSPLWAGAVLLAVAAGIVWLVACGPAGKRPRWLAPVTFGTLGFGLLLAVVGAVDVTAQVGMAADGTLKHSRLADGFFTGLGLIAATTALVGVCLAGQVLRATALRKANDAPR